MNENENETVTTSAAIAADPLETPAQADQADQVETEAPDTSTPQTSQEAQQSPQQAEQTSDAQADAQDAKTVPLARLQGTQRKLAETEAFLAAAQADAAALRAQLAVAMQGAVTARVAQIRATETNIVPDLIKGDTLDQVEQSLADSRAAFAAAAAQVSRQIAPGTPTPAATPPTGPAPGLSLSPTDAIRQGLISQQRKPSLNS